MTSVRRVYLYLVALMSLLMLAAGLAGLGRALVQLLTTPAANIISPGLRNDVAWYGALTLLGLLAWPLHWRLANRAAARDPGERAATLRRLYLYLALAAMVLAAGVSSGSLLDALFRLALPDAPPANARQVLSPAPLIIVAAMFWIYHRRTAAADRAAVGEQGGSATLRRWYVYGVAFVALMVLLGHAAQVLRLTWQTVAAALGGETLPIGTRSLAGASAGALVALSLWLAHWSRWVVADKIADPQSASSSSAVRSGD